MGVAKREGKGNKAKSGLAALGGVESSKAVLQLCSALKVTGQAGLA